MKKLSFIVAIAGVFIAQSNTQAQGLYAGLGVGYGMPSMVGSNTSTSTANFSTGTASYTSNSISLGSGLAVGIYGGYMLNNNFGIELGIGDKFSSSNTATVTTTNAGGTVTSTDNWTTKGGLFRLTPALRMMIGEGKLHPYMVTGLIIGFPSSVTTEDANTTTNPAITNTSDEIWTYSGGLIWGFHGAVGLVYMVSDKIGIFGELAGNFQNWAPSKQLVTTATFNGVDQLGTMTTSQKETDYVSSYSTSPPANPGSPTQSTRIYLPFSSFGINIGVHVTLGGGGAAATPAK